MSDPGQPELLSFLTAEFKILGIPDFDGGTFTPIHGWQLNRDEYGFIVTAKQKAYPILKDYLELVFESPEFDGSGTLIYRNDNHNVTAMLNNTDESTELIVLIWKRRSIRAKMATTIKAAMDKVIKEM